MNNAPAQSNEENANDNTVDETVEREPGDTVLAHLNSPSSQQDHPVRPTPSNPPDTVLAHLNKPAEDQ